MALTKVSNTMIVGSYANAGDYGMSPSASADTNCAALQTALLSGKKTVVVPPGNYSWNPAYMLYNDGTYSQATRVGVSIPSGITLIGYGATLTSVTTNRDNYSMLASFKTTGVNIKGFTLIGDVDTNAPVGTGDYGFGTDFRDVTEASVSDVFSTKMWGDSFYLGVINTAGTGSNGVSFTNIVGTHSRRQGLSITGGQNIKVDNFRFEAIIGAPFGPCAGIDIEPNTAALVQNLQITNGTINYCNRSVQIFKTSGFVIDNILVKGSSSVLPLLSDRVYNGNISNIIGIAEANIYYPQVKYGVIWQLSRTLRKIIIANCQINDAEILPIYIEQDPAVPPSPGDYDFEDIRFVNCDFHWSETAPVLTSVVTSSPHGGITFDSCNFTIPPAFGPAQAVNLTAGSIMNCTNTVWQNNAIENNSAVALSINVGVEGNRGNIFDNITYNEDYAGLANGWSPLAGYQQQVIQSDTTGEIKLFGTIGGGIMLAGTVIVTLPLGYRPKAIETCPITVADGAGNVTASMVEVSPAGDVTLLSTLPYNNKLSLNAIRFIFGS